MSAAVPAHDLVELRVSSDATAIVLDSSGERRCNAQELYALVSRLLDSAQLIEEACPLRPLLDNVVVVEIEESGRKSGGGLHIPDTAREPARRGVVKRVGPGRYEGGVFVPIEGIAVGDIVTYSVHSGYEIKVGSVSYRCLRSCYCMTGVDLPSIL